MQPTQIMIDCVLLISTITVFQKDIERMKRFVKSKYRVRNSSISTLDLSLYTDQFCAVVENQIKRFIEEKMGPSYLIYFTGHGTKKTGNWNFPDKTYMTLQRVLKTWTATTETRSKVNLFLINDSCHSGAWVRILKSYHKNQKHTNVEMVAACGPKDTTEYSEKYGSDFTMAVCDKQCCYNGAPRVTNSKRAKVLIKNMKIKKLKRCNTQQKNTK